jgi:pyridinium-3,5-bisthiocarboxylic acid mononucleotide nickel chelatase
MRIAYFDCFSGVAGDMTLAALIHAGLDPAVLRDMIERLGLPGVTLHVESAKRHGIAATHVDVRIDESEKKAHRHLPHIIDIIQRADFTEPVQAKAIDTFERLAEAEASVHGTTPDKVHFHEVGAADAIVDICGACLGLHTLEIEAVYCSPVPTGSGTVQCAHGLMPVPAPATAELLKGVPIAPVEEPGELTTPTGAALVKTLVTEFGPLPEMRIEQVGYGAGTRIGKTRPNVLRVLVGEIVATPDGETDSVAVLEAQVDDSDGQRLAYTVEQLLAAGALDAYLVPIMMKKGRPGQLITVLTPPAAVATTERILLSETSTLGVRRSTVWRTKLPRRFETVETPYGSLPVKVTSRPGGGLQAWPEYDDCAARAREHQVPLRQVQEAALWAWQQRDSAR